MTPQSFIIIILCVLVVIWCFDIVHKTHSTPFLCIILVVLFFIGHPLCFIVLQNSSHPFLMCHFHCLCFVGCVMCFVILWNLPPPPSHLFIVILRFGGPLMCFIALWMPDHHIHLSSYVYCSTKPSPPSMFVCHGLVFQSALDMFHCFTNSNPPFHMWSLSSYISLFHLVFFVVLSNSPHPHSSSLLFYFFWEPKLHCWVSFLFMKCDPSPYYVLFVLWIITLSLQPIPLGLLVCGEWLTRLVFLNL